MAKFLKVHNEFDREVIINLEHIISIEPEDNYIHLSDCDGMPIPRQSEWNKIMKFIYENEEI